MTTVLHCCELPWNTKFHSCSKESIEGEEKRSNFLELQGQMAREEGETKVELEKEVGRKPKQC